MRAIPMDGSAPMATANPVFKVTDDPVGAINSLIAFVRSPTYCRPTVDALIERLVWNRSLLQRAFPRY
ncbi:hypothetical protein [Tunturiibacter lichenicola]|uniref:hypothetical protein n=1 Tax=Tunturiibacter lichenicola TaxID=2051959 RepID=UPI0021B44579|nr:hypothetical protein [Edaphobacter lichenicola]